MEEFVGPRVPPSLGAHPEGETAGKLWEFGVYASTTPPRVSDVEELSVERCTGGFW